jgi:hypothetical protein
LGTKDFVFYDGSLVLENGRLQASLHRSIIENTTLYSSCRENKGFIFIGRAYENELSILFKEKQNLFHHQLLYSLAIKNL